LSGLGATGSYQLNETFTPSPALLQGKDVADESEDEESDSIVGEVDVGQYHDAYVPRPTRRGHGRKSAAVIQRFDPSLPNPKAKHLVSGIRKKLNEPASAQKASGVKDRRHKTEAKKRGRSSLSAKASPPKKKIKKLYTEDVSDSDSEQSDDNAEVYTPRKTKSRGGIRVDKKRKVVDRHKKIGAKLYTEDVSESDSEQSDDNAEVYTPRKTKSRGDIMSLPSIDRKRKAVDRRKNVVATAKKNASTDARSTQRVSQQLAEVAVDRRQKPVAKKPSKPIKSKVAVKRLSGRIKPRISSGLVTAKKHRR
jgi:hypothetical protein